MSTFAPPAAVPGRPNLEGSRAAWCTAPGTGVRTSDLPAPLKGRTVDMDLSWKRGGPPTRRLAVRRRAPGFGGRLNRWLPAQRLASYLSLDARRLMTRRPVRLAGAGHLVFDCLTGDIMPRRAAVRATPPALSQCAISGSAARVARSAR